MSQLFKLQNHCSTRAVQLLVQVFHLVFNIRHLWCSTHYTLHPAAGGRVAQLPRAPAAAPACVILCDVLLVACCKVCIVSYSVKPDECVANSQ
jgi:hypothetical protein